MSPESKVVRAFIAIPMPVELRAKLAEVQGELKQILPRHSIAWTKPENMHLTLRFLGNVAAERIPQLSEKLKTTLAGFGAINLICERIGCFPDLRYPRVVWAWVHDNGKRLTVLQGLVESAVVEFTAHPPEARFVGHITLARPKQIKRPSAERLSRFVESAVSRQFGSWRPNAVMLIRSELASDGAKYRELFRATLL